MNAEGLTAPTGQTDWLALAARTAHVAMGVSRMADGVFVEVNDAFCRLFVCTREQVVGHTAEQLGLWPQPQQRERMLALIAQQGALNGYPAHYRNLVGETGQVEVSARLVQCDGEPHFIGFLSPVDDRQELIDGLRAAQARLGVVLRATGMLVFRQDTALRYTWVANPALGVGESQILGRTDDDLLGAEAAAPLVAIKQRVLTSGQAERRDVWVANNGQLACFDLVAEPELDALGRVTGLVCAATDITHRMTRLPPDTPSAAGAARAGATLQTIEGLTSLIAHEALSPRQAQRLERIDLALQRLARRLRWDAGTCPDSPAVRAQLRLRHAGKRVLVAEHNPVVREQAVALLEAAGLQVTAAATGVQAFSLALQLAPDLLLLDMEMPQRGAVAAARALRASQASRDGAAPRTPILAMISATPPAGATLALDADLDDVLDKPLQALAVYALVLAWLEGA